MELGEREELEEIGRRGRKEEDDPVPSTYVDFSRKWSELPELALDSILRCLLCFPDLFSFASVCRSWRSLPPALNSVPPLLFLRFPYISDHGNPPNPNPNPNPRSLPPVVIVRITSLFYSTLQTLTLDSFRSNIPLITLSVLPCLGYSRGRLLFLARNPRRILLPDVFTAEDPQHPRPSPLG